MNMCKKKMNFYKLTYRKITFKVESLKEYNSFIEANIDNELRDIQKNMCPSKKNMKNLQK